LRRRRLCQVPSIWLNSNNYIFKEEQNWTEVLRFLELEEKLSSIPSKTTEQ
jgi:hypothetical protein